MFKLELRQYGNADCGTGPLIISFNNLLCIEARKGEILAKAQELNGMVANDSLIYFKSSTKLIQFANFIISLAN